MELKTIDIKGKDYVTVSERVRYFNEEYKNGSITTELVKNDDEVVVKATIIPDIDKPRTFTGYSQAIKGKGHMGGVALENAETSAVGRALGFMGIGIVEGIASADEIHKATQPRTTQSENTPKKSEPISESEWMCPLCPDAEIKPNKSGKGYHCSNFKNHPKDAGYTALVKREEEPPEEINDEIPF